MSAYNCKLVAYPNGSFQLRKYSKPISYRHFSASYEDLTFQQEQALASASVDYLDLNNSTYTINPFDCSISKNFTVSPKKEKQKNNSTSDIMHSVNRTKNKIYSYARCVKWEYFITFTFSPEKVDRYDYSECSRIVRRWLNNQRRNAPDLFYLFVPEQHEDGAWHFHGLIANTGNIKFTDSGKIDRKGKIIYNMSKWSYGFSTATAVSDVHKVAAYIGKYITKDLCQATSGKQRYFVSQNMPEPTVSTFLVPPDEENDFISLISTSLGCSIVHVSSPRHENAYVDVDYIELL